MSEQRFIDHETVDWSTVVAAEYRIDQTIRYDYPAPIRDLRHRLVISPRASPGDQRRVSHELLVTPRVPAQLGAEPFGNEILALDVPYVEESIAFALRSTVVRDARFGPHLVAARALRDRPLHGRRRLIRVDAALADAAAALRSVYRAPAELAEAIVRFVHAEID